MSFDHRAFDDMQALPDNVFPLPSQLAENRCKLPLVVDAPLALEEQPPVSPKGIFIPYGTLLWQQLEDCRVMLAERCPGHPWTHDNIGRLFMNTAAVAFKRDGDMMVFMRKADGKGEPEAQPLPWREALRLVAICLLASFVAGIAFGFLMQLIYGVSL